MPTIGQVNRNKWGAKIIWHACLDCGRERWVALRGNEPRTERCHSCAGKLCPKRHGQGSPNWKGGRWKNSRGYILVLLRPNDFFYPMAGRDGYVLEHRLVVAKALGRCLHRWEIVHHKGAKYPKGSIENKQDNRYPENLQLVSDERHNQITLLENRISYLEKRVTLLEAENVAMKTELSLSDKPNVYREFPKD